jgi:hypothetical protein
MKKLVAGLLALGAMAFGTQADVVIDDAGVGFVGKGDVQSIYGWNNEGLQANAASVQFRYGASGQVTWLCEWWTGKAGTTMGGGSGTLKYHSALSSSELVASAVSYDARKNKVGQVTGFLLNGISPGFGSEQNIGDCGGYGAGKTLVAGSINYVIDSSAAQLEVSIDGINWFPLTITE